MAEGEQPQPFNITIDSGTLDWITQRVQNARVVPDVKQPDGKEWSDGVPSSVINELVEYWKASYDWRKVEARLNSTFKMFTLDIEEGDEVIKLHFVHHRSERPDAIPLLFAHGWPGNFTEVIMYRPPTITACCHTSNMFCFHKVENLLSLASPKDSSQQAFHVIAPTIPGFVFSSSPKVCHTYRKTQYELEYIAPSGIWIWRPADWFGLSQTHAEIRLFQIYWTGRGLGIDDITFHGSFIPRFMRRNTPQHDNGPTSVAHKEPSDTSMACCSLVHTRRKEKTRSYAVVDERRIRLFQDTRH